jgi:hypothetical protein
MREEPGQGCGEFAKDGAAARLKLAALLRSWWQEDPGRATQSSLARRLGERGVKTSQEMLSRYLHRTRPTLARQDVIRALHEVLGRRAGELTEALALHAEAKGDDGAAAGALTGAGGRGTATGAGSGPGPAGDVGARPGAGPGPGVDPGPGVTPGAGAAPAGRASEQVLAAASATSVGAGAPVQREGLGAQGPAAAGAGAAPAAVTGPGPASGFVPLPVAVPRQGSAPGAMPEAVPGAAPVEVSLPLAAVRAGAAPVAGLARGPEADEQDLRWRKWSAAVTAAAAAAAGMVLTAAVTLGDAQQTRVQAPPVCPVAPSGEASPHPN